MSSSQRTRKVRRDFLEAMLLVPCPTSQGVLGSWQPGIVRMASSLSFWCLETPGGDNMKHVYWVNEWRNEWMRSRRVGTKHAPVLHGQLPNNVLTTKHKGVFWPRISFLCYNIKPCWSLFYLICLPSFPLTFSLPNVLFSFHCLGLHMCAERKK